MTIKIKNIQDYTLGSRYYYRGKLYEIVMIDYRTEKVSLSFIKNLRKSK